MKNITKDNKGITLIALLITIIVMLILISITTYTGLDTYKRSKVSKFVTQMQLLQAKIDDLVATKTLDELNNMGLQSISTEEQENAITYAFSVNEEVTVNDVSKYKVFTKDDVLNILDVEDVENDIVVNFETREIIDVVGIEYQGTRYYTQYKLPGGQTIINNTGALTRDLSFVLTEVIDGLNGTITISNIKTTNGTLSYRETGNNYWTTITNYTSAGTLYDIVVTKSAIYEFKLTDNVTGENSNERIEDEKTHEIKEIVPDKNKKEIVLTNKPKTDKIKEYNYAQGLEKWAYAQKDDLNYVWIPRFAYDTNNNIKYIKGNSNIATDNTYIDEKKWSIHNKFTTVNGVELTGIWVRINSDEVNQTGLNMLTLLNDSSRTILIEI